MSDYLPESVMEQILLKLPHTTLLRFSSVCKSWRSLIASHSFSVQHSLSLSNPNPPLLLTRHSTHWSLSTIPYFLPPTITQLEPPYRNAAYPSSFRFLQSLHGLVWSVIDVCHTQELDLSVMFSDTPHFLNGNVHWMAYDADIYSDNKNILMFNVEEEKFKKFELPPKLVKVWFMNMKLTVIDCCLCVLNCKHRRDWCNIWMMREYGVAESWTKMYSFSIVVGGGPSNLFGLSTSAKVVVLKQDPAERESKRERAYFFLHSFTRTSEEISFFDIEGEAISVCEYTPGSLVLLDKA